MVGETVPEEHASPQAELQQEIPGRGDYGDILREPPEIMPRENLKEESGGPSVVVKMPRTRKKLAGGRNGDGTTYGQRVHLSAFVLLALALVAVVFLWKKSKKDERSVR